MDKIPYFFSQDIFTLLINPSCYGNPHCLKSRGEISIFDHLWMSNSDKLILDDSNRYDQFEGFW